MDTDPAVLARNDRHYRRDLEDAVRAANALGGPRLWTMATARDVAAFVRWLGLEAPAFRDHVEARRYLVRLHLDRALVAPAVRA